MARHRSTHGVVCSCSCTDVIVVSVSTRTWPRSYGRELLKTQYLKCRSCDRHWTHVVRIEEHFVR